MFKNDIYRELASTGTKKPKRQLENPLVCLPADIQLAIIHTDFEINKKWALLCYGTATSTRFNAKLDKYGTWEARDKRGRLRRRVHFNSVGLKEGTYKSWHRKGTLKVWARYHLGQKRGKYESFYSNTNREILSHYKYNVKHGPYKTFFRNGDPMVECNYYKGRFHGQYRQWNKEGHLIGYIEFKRGKRHGLYKRWENGILTAHALYERGVLVRDRAMKKSAGQSMANISPREFRRYGYRTSLRHT
mmetsp:Transcript_22845/g.25425  ORF Transcript_22845/g.25425 Transcript_22845/m.25425 type:complete len:246 (+) Transcript_22845:63-800(+)